MEFDVGDDLRSVGGGLDELLRELDEAKDDLDTISFQRFFTDRFLQNRTRFENITELFDASPIKLDLPSGYDDISEIPFFASLEFNSADDKESFDLFISQNTDYESWEQFKDSAVGSEVEQIVYSNMSILDESQQFSDDLCYIMGSGSDGPNTFVVHPSDSELVHSTDDFIGCQAYHIPDESDRLFAVSWDSYGDGENGIFFIDSGSVQWELPLSSVEPHLTYIRTKLLDADTLFCPYSKDGPDGLSQYNIIIIDSEGKIIYEIEDVDSSAVSDVAYLKGLYLAYIKHGRLEVIDLNNDEVISSWRPPSKFFATESPNSSDMSNTVGAGEESDLINLPTIRFRTIDDQLCIEFVDNEGEIFTRTDLTGNEV